MEYPFFTGKRTEPISNGYKWIQASSRSQESNPKNYCTEDGLIDAINVALLMGQPLLLTGEPGTGKTQLAYRIAWELGFDPPLKFETKSDSSAKDLFYHYDSLSRFHAAQVKETVEQRNFITYNALGEAIIRSHGSERYGEREVLPEDFSFGSCPRSVVLIDEIDKAPRDFPNDILNELEWLYFRVPELGNITFESKKGMEPIVIITSNSEKDLPDAFLRRCVFYHIQFPDQERLRHIVENRLSELAADQPEFLSDALTFFDKIRSPSVGLIKKPATAELISWLTALSRIKKNENPFVDEQGAIINSLGTLIKSRDDLKAAQQVVAEWFRK